jgi:hypothetical protein
MLQKKLNTVLIEPDELLHDAPSKFKDQLPPNSTLVCILILFFDIKILLFNK